MQLKILDWALDPQNIFFLLPQRTLVGQLADLNKSVD